jgi:hypothetical protein
MLVGWLIVTWGIILECAMVVVVFDAIAMSDENVGAKQWDNGHYV